MTKLLDVRKALRERIRASMTMELSPETLSSVEDIAYNSVQSLKPNILRRLMIECLSGIVHADSRTIILLAEIPFLVAAEMAMMIIAARQQPA